MWNQTTSMLSLYVNLNCNYFSVRFSFQVLKYYNVIERDKINFRSKNRANASSYLPAQFFFRFSPDNLSIGLFKRHYSLASFNTLKLFSLENSKTCFAYERRKLFPQMTI